MRKHVEGVHVGVLLHGRRQIELGHEVAGVGQQSAELRVRDKALGVAGGVPEHMRHLRDVQHVHLAACMRLLSLSSCLGIGNL